MVVCNLIPQISPPFTLRLVIFSGLFPPLVFCDMVAIFCLIKLSRKNGLKVVYSLISLHGAILLCKVC